MHTLQLLLILIFKSSRVVSVLLEIIRAGLCQSLNFLSEVGVVELKLIQSLFVLLDDLVTVLFLMHSLFGLGLHKFLVVSEKLLVLSVELLKLHLKLVFEVSHFFLLLGQLGLQFFDKVVLPSLPLFYISELSFKRSIIGLKLSDIGR